jgi:hypothetical protein
VLAANAALDASVCHARVSDARACLPGGERRLMNQCAVAADVAALMAEGTLPGRKINLRIAIRHDDDFCRAGFGALTAPCASAQKISLRT